MEFHAHLTTMKTPSSSQCTAVFPIFGPSVAFHRTYIDRLAKVDAAARGESGFQIFLDVRPDLPKNSETDVPSRCTGSSCLHFVR